MKYILCVLAIISTNIFELSASSYPCPNRNSSQSNNIPKSPSPTPESRLDALLKSSEGLLLLSGWKDAELHGYDTSVLTKEEKELFICDSIQAFALSIEEEPTLSVFLSNILVNYFYKKKDLKKTLFWAFKGAEKGSSLSMRVLSDAYKCGEGVVQDLEEGLKWAFLGAASGDAKCKQWVQEHGAEGLLYEEIAPIFKEARRRANQWMKEHQEIFISQE